MRAYATRVSAHGKNEPNYWVVEESLQKDNDLRIGEIHTQFDVAAFSC